MAGRQKAKKTGNWGTERLKDSKIKNLKRQKDRKIESMKD